MSPRLGTLTLVLITLVWGSTFVIVKDALSSIAVPLLLALRFTLAALALGWVRFEWRALGSAFVLGLLAFAGFASQTVGLKSTSASNAAFITGLSVILVPLIGAWWLRRAVAPRVYGAALLALAGLGLMTLKSATGIAGGDLWVLLTALTYALYIVYLGEVAGRAHALSLASLQHWPMALLAWLWALPRLSELRAVPPATWLAVLYLALVATAAVAVLQTYAQRVVPAHTAALIFVLEPVFAALFAYLLLGETLSPWGWLGAALILAAMLLSELGSGLRRRAPRRVEK